MNKRLFQKQNAPRAGWQPAAAAVATQSVVFWFVLAALGNGAVGPGVWLALHGLLALGLVALDTRPCTAARWRAHVWLAVAFYAVFLAAFFAGADLALDALHGAQRRRAQMPALLGGLELWQLLCPGAFSLASGALVRSLWVTKRRP